MSFRLALPFQSASRLCALSYSILASVIRRSLGFMAMPAIIMYASGSLGVSMTARSNSFRTMVGMLTCE